MTNKEAVQLSVQLETGEAKAGLEELSGLLEGLKSIVRQIGAAIKSAFMPDTGNLTDAQKTFQGMADSLDTVTGKLEEIVALMTPQEESFLESAISGVDGFNELAEASEHLKNIHKGITGVKSAAGGKGDTGFLDALVKKGSDLADVLKNNVFSPEKIAKLGTAFSTVGQKMMSIGKTLGSALISPAGLAVMGITALIAIIVLLVKNWDKVKAALITAAEWINTNVIQTVANFFVWLGTGIAKIWNDIVAFCVGIAQWVQDNVIQPVVNFITMAVDWISAKVQEGIAFVQGVFAGINEFLQGVFAKDWTEQFGAFGNVLNAFFANVENIWNAIKTIFGGIVDFVKNVFAGDWSAAWDSVVNIFKGIWELLVSFIKVPVNGIIGMINGLVQGVVDGINLVIGALNKLQVKIPDQGIFGSLAGMTIGFNITPLTAPKIPLLAKGAVLPANRPFLAMVGDQRHGTNVEAPLATIQEAVAMVMEDQFSGMMAGFEASVGVQRQILQAVLGIEVGDTTIGQAAARYNRRMAVIKGGM